MLQSALVVLKCVLLRNILGHFSWHTLTLAMNSSHLRVVANVATYSNVVTRNWGIVMKE